MPVHIITCEHAGNEIPDTYQHLFKGQEEVLYSHKAIDFGAFELAQELSQKTNWLLFSTSTSRLLVEANRSLDNDSLFSKYSKKLSEKEQEEVLAQYYFPHRNQVEHVVEKATKAGQQVVHWAIHTFTPVKDGNVREAEIGILFDPDRASESTFAEKLKKSLLALNPHRKVLFNSPYPGVDDGLPTYLRTKFSDAHYAGFELEINQKFFLDGDPKIWHTIIREVTNALKTLE